MGIVSDLIDEGMNSPMLFGIHENVCLGRVLTDPVKKRDGSVSSQLFEIQWVIKGEDESDIVGNFKIFPMKHDVKPDTIIAYVRLNYLQLASILICYYRKEDLDQIFNAYAAVGIQKQEEIKTVLSKKSNMDLFNKKVVELFEKVSKPLLYDPNKENNYMFRLKVVQNGGYTELPKLNFIEPMDISKQRSKLRMSPQDIKNYNEAITQKSPDDLSNTSAPVPPGIGGLPNGSGPGNFGSMPNGGPALPGTPTAPGAPAPSPSTAGNPLTAFESQSKAAPAVADPNAVPEPQTVENNNVGNAESPAMPANQPAQPAQPVSQPAQPVQAQPAPEQAVQTSPSLPNAPFSAPSVNNLGALPGNGALGNIPGQ